MVNILLAFQWLSPLFVAAHTRIAYCTRVCILSRSFVLEFCSVLLEKQQKFGYTGCLRPYLDCQVANAMSDKLDRDTLFKKLRAKPENKASLTVFACLATPAQSISVHT